MEYAVFIILVLWSYLYACISYAAIYYTENELFSNIYDRFYYNIV